MEDIYLNIVGEKGFLKFGNKLGNLVKIYIVYKDIELYKLFEWKCFCFNGGGVVLSLIYKSIIVF